MLFLLTISIVKAESPYSLNGIFTDVDNYREILVKTYKRGIKIKGIQKRHPHKWVKFERENRYVFVDRNGNHVKLRDRRRGAQIIYKSRRGNTRIFQEGVIRNSYGNSCRSDYNFDNRHDHFGSGYNYNDYSDRGYGSYDHNSDYGDRSDRHNRINRSSFEGTYETAKGRKIAILNTRTGFKAKFSGERVWKSYDKVNERFEDRDGNYYILSGPKRMQWNGKYSGKKREITKISDEVRY
jgi:hypothetical protein